MALALAWPSSVFRSFSEFWFGCLVRVLIVHHCSCSREAQAGPAARRRVPQRSASSRLQNDRCSLKGVHHRAREHHDA